MWASAPAKITPSITVARRTPTLSTQVPSLGWRPEATNVPTRYALAMAESERSRPDERCSRKTETPID